jgi:addiction module toxin, RelE/StbE family
MSNNGAFQVVWLRLALQDMRQTATYVAQDFPEAAKDLVNQIWLEGQSLCALPDRGRPGRVPGTRELMLKGLPYFLAYRVKGKTIQILRVVHTARQWPLMF